jgi:hypothetical protein
VTENVTTKAAYIFVVAPMVLISGCILIGAIARTFQKLAVLLLRITDYDIIMQARYAD